MNKVCDVLSGLVAQIKELRDANKEIRGETQALKRQMLNVALQQQDKQRVAALLQNASPGQQQQQQQPQQQQPQQQGSPPNLPIQHGGGGRLQQGYGTTSRGLISGALPSIGDDIGPYGLVDGSEEARVLEQEREAAIMEAQHQQQQQQQQGGVTCQYPFLITNAHKPFAMVKRNPKGDSSKADGSFIAANHSFLKLFGYSEVNLFFFCFFCFFSPSIES
jgi:PAS domain-containing protein